jgi:hypothetical protein
VGVVQRYKIPPRALLCFCCGYLGVLKSSVLNDRNYTEHVRRLTVTFMPCNREPCTTVGQATVQHINTYAARHGENRAHVEHGRATTESLTSSTSVPCAHIHTQPQDTINAALTNELRAFLRLHVQFLLQARDLLAQRLARAFDSTLDLVLTTEGQKLQSP